MVATFRVNMTRELNQIWCMWFLSLCKLGKDVTDQLSRVIKKETAGIAQRFLRNQGTNIANYNKHAENI